MAKTKEKAVEPVVVIEIGEQEKETRTMDIGGKSVQFSSPTSNVLEIKAAAKTADIAALIIDSQAMLEIADEELRALKGTEKALNAMRESVSAPLYQAWEANNALYRKPLLIIKDGITALTRKITGYHEEVERKARIAREEAERKAEEERERVRREAEELERQAAEAAMSADSDSAAEEADALFLAADAKTMEAEVIVPEYVESAPAKIAGSSIRYTYAATIPDTAQKKRAALKYLLDNPQFLNLVTFSQPEANRLAAALKENFSIPGFELEKKASISQRGVTARSI